MNKYIYFNPTYPSFYLSPINHIKRESLNDYRKVYLNTNSKLFNYLLSFTYGSKCRYFHEYGGRITSWMEENNGKCQNIRALVRDDGKILSDLHKRDIEPFSGYVAKVENGYLRGITNDGNLYNENSM